MLLSDFDLPFDPALVATQPVEPRDHARLLVCDRSGAGLRHHRVWNLPELLAPGDLVIVNNSKVVPARLHGTKRPGGGRVAFVVTAVRQDGLCQVLLKGRFRRGQVIELAEGATAEVVERSAEVTTVKLTGPCPLPELLDRIGDMPLPPYMKRDPIPEDRQWYQTVFAEPKGSIAAPTAGLHFTPGLLNALAGRGVRLASITLHVGPGTFLPVRAAQIEAHRMLPEWYTVPQETMTAMAATKSAGGRVIGVGTTVVRALESAVLIEGTAPTISGETSLYITPGYRFQVIDGLLTNFHLPRTTLAILVAAFVGLDRLRALYDEAVRQRYRFYSYGDAMLIL